MTQTHPTALVEEPRGITTPIVANAIELFNVRPRNRESVTDVTLGTIDMPLDTEPLPLCPRCVLLRISPSSWDEQRQSTSFYRARNC
jgi:hypothetical protein